MEKLTVEMLIFSAGGMAALVGKIVWDWIKSGRAESGLYMKTSDCNQVRKDCCVGTIKGRVHTLETELAEHGIRLHETEKQLDRGREDFKAIREDIGKIRSSLDRMTAIFEASLKNFNGKVES